MDRRVLDLKIALSSAKVAAVVLSDVGRSLV
jgi:hypothetical protein